MNTVEFRDVKKSFGNFTLNMDYLDIKKGYITGFIGPNGAGKTTTIKLIMNMIYSDSGVITVFDKDVNKQGKEVREDIGYVGDVSGFIEENKVKEIKKVVSQFYKNWDEEMYKSLMLKFKINEKSKYAELSKGMKKQFELALALSHHPKFLIMDEPTSNLDPLVRNDILDILLEYMQDEENTIFYSSHITTDLEKACDYIIFIDNGGVMLQGEKDELLSNYVIVKGKNSLLTEDTVDVLVSYTKNSFGFEGLAKDKRRAFNTFGEEAQYEKATLEDILMFYKRRGK